MKLCILNSKIESEPLCTKGDKGLYHLTIKEYKKQILKGNVCMSEYINARLCYLYSRDILRRRFELGEEMISMHG